MECTKPKDEPPTDGGSGPESAPLDPGGPPSQLPCPALLARAMLAGMEPRASGVRRPSLRARLPLCRPPRCSLDAPSEDVERRAICTRCRIWLGDDTTYANRPGHGASRHGAAHIRHTAAAVPAAQGLEHALEAQRYAICGQQWRVTQHASPADGNWSARECSMQYMGVLTARHSCKGKQTWAGQVAWRTGTACRSPQHPNPVAELPLAPACHSNMAGLLAHQRGVQLLVEPEPSLPRPRGLQRVLAARRKATHGHARLLRARLGRQRLRRTPPPHQHRAEHCQRQRQDCCSASSRA